MTNSDTSRTLKQCYIYGTHIIKNDKICLLTLLITSFREVINDNLFAHLNFFHSRNKQRSLLFSSANTTIKSFIVFGNGLDSVFSDGVSDVVCSLSVDSEDRSKEICS